IAVVGLGAMGSAAAANLVGKGHDVRGVDLRQVALDALREAGGSPETSIARAVAGADAVVTFVVNAAQVDAVVSGPTGIAATMDPEAVLIQCATVSASFIARLGELSASGRHLVDAPVSGGVSGAKAGALTIMASGPREAMARARPVLDEMGTHVHDFGDVLGAGSMVKTINQLFCGVHLAVLGEAIALGKRAGLDPRRLLEVYGNSAAASWMMKDRGPRALQDAPPSNSTIDIFVKDLALVLDAGRDLKFPLPLAAAAHQMFLSGSAAGKGAVDDSHLWEAYPRPMAEPEA
ncbi:MAG TPA: NAD(P)-dependent oxidoreductase, partial [Lautropia sp.]|nr:NAD(P)-dependent oxidoreductase [Lautropia sp.]